MGIGAAFAAKKVLEKTHFSIDDMDLIEANEAFTAQSLATLKANANRVNISGCGFNQCRQRNGYSS